MPYYEDLAQPFPGGKLFGYRRVEELPKDRKAGYEGMIPIILTASVRLLKGYKGVTLRASEKEPVEVWSCFMSSEP